MTNTSATNPAPSEADILDVRRLLNQRGSYRSITDLRKDDPDLATLKATAEGDDPKAGGGAVRFALFEKALPRQPDLAALHKAITAKLVAATTATLGLSPENALSFLYARSSNNGPKYTPGTSGAAPEVAETAAVAGALAIAPGHNIKLGEYLVYPGHGFFVPIGLQSVKAGDVSIQAVRLSGIGVTGNKVVLLPVAKWEESIAPIADAATLERTLHQLVEKKSTYKGALPRQRAGVVRLLMRLDTDIHSCDPAACADAINYLRPLFKGGAWSDVGIQRATWAVANIAQHYAITHKVTLTEAKDIVMGKGDIQFNDAPADAALDEETPAAPTPVRRRQDPSSAHPLSAAAVRKPR